MSFNEFSLHYSFVVGVLLHFTLTLNKNTEMSSLSESAEFKALAAHRDALRATHMRELFAADPDRFAKFSLEFERTFARRQRLFFFFFF